MLHTCKATIQTNEIRRLAHNGAEHVVVPVVMIVDGVMNGALVTHEEYGKLVETWNDKPVTIGHPQVNGEHVSAGSPDIIEKSSMGRIYNARVDGDKLIGEIWVDAAKADRIGRTELLAALESGNTVEVSTGYFSAAEDKQGEHNGKMYTCIHRDLVPDHLAVLPNEIGACSVADGCGTRPNVFTRIAQAFGMRAHTNEERTMCTKKDQVEKLVGNAKLSAEQLELLMGMDEEQLAMLQAIAGGMQVAAPTPEPETAEMEDKPDLEEMVANAVAKVTKAPVIERIKSNSANVLDDATLNAMSADQLGKYEQSIRPVDYSGAGGTVNTNSTSGNAPLVPRKLVSVKGAK